MDAVVLAGGSARRLGGVDKALLRIGGRALIDRVLDALSHARIVVVVGPRRTLDREVRWAREEPPGGGPVAALAAGLALVEAGAVAVAAVDHPFLTAGLYESLVTAARGHDGAIAQDASGRDQYLVGVFETERLRAALAGRRALKDVAAQLDLARVVDMRASFDIDTEADLMKGQEDVRGMG
jgi:molybdopterin-guanine dinucleotide biosynthesis protein A